MLAYLGRRQVGVTSKRMLKRETKLFNNFDFDLTLLKADSMESSELKWIRDYWEFSSFFAEIGSSHNRDDYNDASIELIWAFHFDVCGIERMGNEAFGMIDSQ